MSKLTAALCLGMLTMSINIALAEITTPTQPEDFTKDIYNRFSCGGYAITHQDSGIDFYIENTSELACTYASFTENKGRSSCPPTKWLSEGCDNYYATYNRLISDRFRLQHPDIERPRPPHFYGYE